MKPSIEEQKAIAAMSEIVGNKYTLQPVVVDSFIGYIAHFELSNGDAYIVHMYGTATPEVFKRINPK